MFDTSVNTEAKERVSPRRLAVDILVKAEQRRAYVDLLLRAELSRSRLDKRDRAFVSELVRGTVRWRRYLRWVLKKRYRGDYFRAPLKFKAILELAAYELFFHRSTPGYAVVSEAVSLAKQEGGRQWAAKANAILRRLEATRAKPPQPNDPDSVRGLSIATSHPEWLVRRWIRQFGKDSARALLEADNVPAPLFLRVNTARFDPERVARELEEFGASVRPVPHFGEYLRIEHLAGPVEEMTLFRNGAITPQDPSASLPVALLDVKPHDRVWDVCAAPGGKTTAIAEKLGDGKGLVVAGDVHLQRARLVRTAAQRLALSTVKPICADATRPPARSAAKILVDAPCSGTGVLRRRVDARWQRSEEDIAKLRETQLAILDAVAEIAVRGGVVVYSTCTLERDENEEVVEAFLSRHREFSVDHAGSFVPAEFVTEEGFVRTFPHTHDLDGTFAARLLRTE